MGGLAGIIHFRGDPPPRDQAHQLSAGVAHRGPDDKGLWSDGPAIFVHRRFKVRPVETPEPVVNDALVLVLDGRLPAGSDRLVERWAEVGPGALPELCGEFAFAVWDRREHVLWLCRDATGTRPLFWACDGPKVAFASEIRPLLGLPWVSNGTNLSDLAEYLAFRYVHAPRTLLRDVAEVPPGHFVRIDASGARTERWWVPRWPLDEADAPDEAETADKVDALIRRGVERRLGGEAPIAVLLSGGLNSSAILYHACRMGQPPATFTVAMGDDPSDESAFAGRVATVFGAEHHVVRVPPSALGDAVLPCTQAMGQPLPAVATIVQYLLYKEIRATHRVLLSGDGGDEVLGGRRMEKIAGRMRWSRGMGRLPLPARWVGRKAAKAAGLDHLAASVSQFGLDTLIGGTTVFDMEARVGVLRDPGLVRPGIRKLVLESFYAELSSDPINEILHVWQRGSLPQDSLARSDRMAAHLGLEVRYPMLDPDLVQYAATLPGRAKVRRKRVGHVTKWPLRKAMADRLPGPLLSRPKRSLPSPLLGWLIEPGADFLKRRIEAICDDPEGLFVPSTVRQLADRYRAGDMNLAFQLWTLILYQAWRETLLGV